MGTALGTGVAEWLVLAVGKAMILFTVWDRGGAEVHFPIHQVMYFYGGPNGTCIVFRVDTFINTPENA